MKTILNLSVAAIILAGGAYLYADDDQEEGEHRYRSSMVSKPLSKQDQATTALYTKECGACHFAYQPEFLPKNSWDKTMKTLNNHFGTDATLEPIDYKTIQNYLMVHASKYDRMTGRGGAISTRISETPNFIHEHREIPKKMVTQADVKSFANCASCHTKAASGSYREREVRIPNYVNWED